MLVSQTKSAAESPSAAFAAGFDTFPRLDLPALWHLLSLDAPTVAVLWTVFIAKLTGTRLGLITPVAMGLAVWVLYATDRLLDAKQLGNRKFSHSSGDLELRHVFHHRHRSEFTKGLTVCAVALAFLLPQLRSAALRLYLMEGIVLAGYFLLIHSRPPNIATTFRIPKEILLGPFFSAATFIPTVSRRPDLRPELLPLATLFAALCSLNCLYIYAWEHPGSKKTWLTSHLGILSLVLTTAALLCSSGPQVVRPYPLACAASALLLTTLHTHRARLSPLSLRVAADAALLTPLIFLPLLRVFHS